MIKKLTIIIPCYNCSLTLEEAVNSIYKQNLIMPFEIVMVDDASIDNTKEVIEQLAIKFKEIKYIFHEQNKGGGATRNTAIENSEGDIIFCLDSDDILGDDSLNKMYQLLINKNLDGVSICKSIKFLGSDINNVQYVTEMDYINQLIPFESLFDRTKQCGLYSTFMHTKDSFISIGGYPTKHGFDTQEFAIGFLANGFKAMGCKDAIYFHRLSIENNSYYNREYKNGKINYNWYKIFEKYIYFFDEKIKDKILNFDIYENITKKSIIDFFDYSNIFDDEYKKYITHNTKANYYKYLTSKERLDKYELYWLSIYENDLEQKFLFLSKSIINGLKNSYQYKQLFELIQELNGDDIKIINNKLNKHFIKQTLFTRIKNRINKLWRNR